MKNYWIIMILAGFVFLGCNQGKNADSLAVRACECAEKADSFKEKMIENYDNPVERQRLIEEAHQGEMAECNSDMKQFSTELQNGNGRQLMEDLEDECPEVYEQLKDVMDNGKNHPGMDAQLSYKSLSD